MSARDLLALLPLMSLSLGAIVLMLQIAFRRNSYWSWSISLLTLVVTAVCCLAGEGSQAVTPLLSADHYARLFSLVFVSVALLIVLLSKEYLADLGKETEEYYLLLLLSTLGAMVLAYASHLASLILGLELMGVALYALIAYPDQGRLPLEAAVKYLVLSGAASAMLLFGFALLYAATGSLAFSDIAGRLSVSVDPLLLNGAALLIFAGLAFKLSVVPFHLWTPDVYQGAPSPVAGFLATVSKAAVFVALLRWYLAGDWYSHPGLVTGITWLAVASMLVGNLLALRQQNLKRLLAYSSIAHMGYLLIVVIACGHHGDRELAVEAAAYYLLAYITATLAAFALVGLLAGSGQRGESEQIEDLTGLFWRQWPLALLMTLSLLSLAGIPLTAGFIGKLYLFTAGIDGALWGPIAALVAGSGIGIYYYLRIVYTMSKPPAEPAEAPASGPLPPGRAAVFALIYLILYLGIFPQSLMAYLSTRL